MAFAVAALVGAAILLGHQSRPRRRPTLDLPGNVIVAGALFCLVFGLANAETNSWGAPSAWGFLIAAAPLMAGFVVLQTRVAHPLLPLRILLDRNRGGAYLAILLLGVGMFGILLFMTYFDRTLLQVVASTPPAPPVAPERRRPHLQRHPEGNRIPADHRPRADARGSRHPGAMTVPQPATPSARVPAGVARHELVESAAALPVAAGQ